MSVACSFFWRVVKHLVVVSCLAVSLVGQQELPDSPKPQNVPDAPSTTLPSPPTPPLPRTPPPAATSDQGPQPPTPVPTSAPGPKPRNSASGDTRDDLFTLTKNVNFVLVPVTVKDQSGRLVEGLLPRDFAVLENGVPQELKLFTSDPFPLSAAVVIDLGMSDGTVQKINKTLSSLGGAFAQFDEVAIFTYDNTVHEAQDFTAAISEQLSNTLRRMKRQRGRAGGVPVTGGPMHTPVPTINGRAADPGQQPVVNAPPAKEESRVLNDAILAAGQSLAKRDRARRKVIFVISDGRELGSFASYDEVRKVLLSNEISVYAVAVGGAAIPIYGTLQKLPVPGLGYGDILPKYASATGGEVFTELSQQAIEQAYSRLTEDARNQYTLGYTTRPTPSSTFRSIEVRVYRPGVKVYAKDGYYPLPSAGRQGP